MGKAQDRSTNTSKRGNTNKPTKEKPLPNKGKSLLNARSEAEYKTSTTQAILKIKRGISQKELLHLKAITGLEYEKVAFILGLTRQTITQKPATFTYEVSESDKIYRIADLYSYGYDVFENREGFNKWMRTENASLGNKKPIDFLDTMYGFQEIKDLIGRIDYGVYS